MKRFEFPLDNILSLKRHDENTVLAQYAAAVSELSKAKANAILLKKRLTDEWRTHQEHLQNEPHSLSLIQTQSGWKYIEEKISDAEEAINQAETNVARLGGELKERRQARKSLESYRSQRERIHRTEFERLEQIELDGLAGQGPRQRY